MHGTLGAFVVYAVIPRTLADHPAAGCGLGSPTETAAPRPREIATFEVTMIDLESKDKLDLTSPNGHAVLQTIKLVDQH